MGAGLTAQRRASAPAPAAAAADETTRSAGSELVTGEVAGGQDRDARLDQTGRAFLEHRRGTWRHLNVPDSDGQLLHDLIGKHRFTRALEIGTSTGHSGVWIAWALAKTGGRLTTIELDPERHRIAVATFKEAGLAPCIDARLG